MDKSGLTRRGLTAGLAAAVAPSGSASGTSSDGTWATLVQELWAAEQAQKVAIAGLAEAEKGFITLPVRRRKGKQPNSYLAAQHAEMAAGEAIEAVHRRIAKTPAVTKQRLAIKMRLLATAYGIDPDTRVIRPGEDDDLVACLIRSLIADLSDEG